MQKPTKIIHITTAPQTLGFLRGLVRHTKSKGFEVEALSSPGRELSNFGEDEGVHVYPIDMPRSITPLRDLLAIYRMTRLFRRIEPTIVHAHTPKGGLLGMISARLARSPIRVYHIHGLPYVTATGYKRVLLRLSEKVSCRLAQQVFCVSASVAKCAVNEKMCPKEKIKVLANGSICGVDAIEEFNPSKFGNQARKSLRAAHKISPDAFVIGFAGRIVRDKGIVELWEAWRMIRNGHTDLHLLIAGEFEDQDPVPKDIERALREDSRVHLLGKMDNMPAVYAEIDLLVLPSYREGFGMAAIEASAMKLPVVATRIPGCVDAVQDGVTGTLVPSEDPQALAEAILSYIENPELRKKHGEAGRRRALECFRPEDIWNATLLEYQRLLPIRFYI